MTMTTKGYDLVRMIEPAVPEEMRRSGGGWRWACSRICRLATTHGRLAEAECNRELSKAEQRKVETVEAKILELVRLHLPFVRSVEFSGDPRGYTVKLIVPDPQHEGRNLYNTFGGSEAGLGVPQ